MNELASHIEYVLLSRKSVIVPMLGEFRTMCTPARWVASENLFIPPVRNVHFDSSVTFDPEEIFLQSFAEIHNLTPAESLKRCEEVVAEFHKMLVTEGSVDFGSIGVFTLEDDAEITMASCECGVTTPSYYGLDALHFKKLEAVVEEKVEEVIFVEKPACEHAEVASNANEMPKDELPEESSENFIPAEAVTVPEHEATEAKSDYTHKAIQDDENHLTIRIKKSVLKYAMTIAATIALFFIVRPTTIVNSHANNKAALSFMQPHMVQPTIEEPYDFVKDLPVEEVDSFDAVLVDITQDALSEGYDFAEETMVEGSNETVIPADEIVNTSLTVSNNTSPADSKVKENTSPADSKVKKNASPAASKVKENVSVAVPTQNTTQAKSSTATATNKPATMPAAAPVSTLRGSFNIVLASAISRANAQVFIDKLAKQNVKASLYEKGNMRRVVVAGFSTKAEAYNYINSMKKSHPDFAEAWVAEQ